MISEGQKGVKNVFLWAVNTIMLYLGPNEVTGLKKSKQFLLVVRSLCAGSHFQTKIFLSLVAGREKLIISHLWGVYILIFSPVGLMS